MSAICAIVFAIVCIVGLFIYDLEWGHIWSKRK